MIAFVLLILLLIISLLLFVAAFEVSTSAYRAARKYVPNKFQDEITARTVFHLFVFSPSVPMELQRRYLAGNMLGLIACGGFAAFCLIIGKYDMGILFGLVFLIGIWSCILSWRAYQKQ